MRESATGKSSSGQLSVQNTQVKQTNSSIGQPPLKVMNEVLKKCTALEGLQIVHEKKDIREACKILDQYRAEVMTEGREVMSEDIKKKLLDVCTFSQIPMFNYT